MLGLIVRQVRQQEEVTEAVVQLQLGCGEVVIVQTQVGHEKALNVPFPLNSIPNG